jgi:predicted cupin superfamily sugar epimerase
MTLRTLRRRVIDHIPAIQPFNPSGIIPDPCRGRCFYGRLSLAVGAGGCPVSLPAARDVAPSLRPNLSGPAEPPFARYTDQNVPLPRDHAVKYLTLVLILLSSLVTEHVNAAPRPTAEALIKHFNMTQIPQEGPWFALTYRSPDVLARGALPERYDGTRAAGSAIIGIVTRAAFSALHRLKTDEIWHYYGGDPLQLLVLYPNGSGEVVVLGPDVLKGDKLQYVVPRGAWQGAMPLGKGREAYSIFGATLAPGFEYSDFEIGYRDELQRLYPSNAEAIARLTREEFITRPVSTGNKVESQKSVVPGTVVSH